MNISIRKTPEEASGGSFDFVTIVHRIIRRIKQSEVIAETKYPPGYVCACGDESLISLRRRIDQAISGYDADDPDAVADVGMALRYLGRDLVAEVARDDSAYAEVRDYLDDQDTVDPLSVRINGARNE